MGRVLEYHEVVSHLAEEKRAGGRVVFANGCFDVLHVGHVRYLEAAKALGDILVVAVNDDQSVRMVKGPPRPFVPQNERAELVAAFKAVDYVFLFSDSSVDRLLVELAPHVHAKGTDYTEETVPERETMEHLGGETRVVGDPKDHASRDLIAAILESYTAESPDDTRRSSSTKGAGTRGDVKRSSEIRSSGPDKSTRGTEDTGGGGRAEGAARPDDEGGGDSCR